MFETQRGTWVGDVIDVACIRKAPSADLLDRASVHTTRCALMGHRIESGFGVVDDGRVHLLEPAATTDVTTAGFVLGSDDPRAVVPVIELSRASYRKVLQDLARAAGCNAPGAPSPATA